MVEYMLLKSSFKDHINLQIIKEINCINVKSVVIVYINCFINFIMPNRQDFQNHSYWIEGSFHNSFSPFF